MKNYITHDEWCIVEQGFHAENNKISESLFSIGNGKFGQRATFEEHYTGHTMQGSYVAGIYYPDKTRVGWWKNGYPEYFAKVLNAPDWKSIHVTIDNTILDINSCQVLAFTRTLDMREGTLNRKMHVRLASSKELIVETQRFCSMAYDECAVVKFSITPLTVANIAFSIFIDGNVRNADSNYDELFWEQVDETVTSDTMAVTCRTKKSQFTVTTAAKYEIYKNNEQLQLEANLIKSAKYAGHDINIMAAANETLTICKYIGIATSENYETTKVANAAISAALWAYNKGYQNMLADQCEAWSKKWSEADINIKGDVAAQQAIRFNIFQLNQTYTGRDARLNIGPKGFTGEKYGGSTYWDTEAYCIPFYLSNADASVAKNLLLYRYKHLPKAIENASKLGFSNGAALYPMVTMNGEECHNEWEITFEEIHRNGAIAYAIYQYSNYTGDKTYLFECGVEVLIGIARFWAQRVNWSNDRNKYVMLGVTGPNEYENNVNNNWYTNYLSRWCLQYAMESLQALKKYDVVMYKHLIEKTAFNEGAEIDKWNDIVQNMYLPEDNGRNIFLQQDGYMDKEQILAKELPASERPLNQKWSWDRILRSCFIKQADVLQGIYFFEHQFTKEQIKANFEFYEPRTVHESSLSPCVHAILACSIGSYDKAYEMYMRTSRLDLDDYNNDTEDGCHTTSMAGTWMSIVYGFGGMRIKDDMLCFAPSLPTQWQELSFKIRFRQHILQISVTRSQVIIENITASNLNMMMGNKLVEIKPESQKVLNIVSKNVVDSI